MDQEGRATTAQVDLADPVTEDPADLADLVTAAPADPVTAAPVAPVDQVDPVTEDLADLAGQATMADPMTAAGTGARHRPICPGAGWTRAGSTTSRSITTAGG